ncbi:hypothetical protein OTK49_03170 [Vibrio coralliirubri]|uniref:hypothetical protein n=1 Tax=Vibrio coralliirubri TaxID=1516159 RepID=UPI002283C852|nr:hypothetical protein [Vibrio coralliirubri]MCY9861517.1 hypothetical protein [Vibrio coralliirubri]
MAHQYQAAIDFINERGNRSKPVKSAHTPYKILKWLADAKGIPMNGARVTVAGLNRISDKALNKRVHETLSYYCETGVLRLPPLFNARKSDAVATDHKGSLYLHDRDENANRNLWNESSKLKNHQSQMLKNESSHKGKVRLQGKSATKNIKNPRDLALALAKMHKQGEIILGQRALMTVASVLDKKATDGQMRTMAKEADKYGIKLGFKPKCL